MEALVLGSASPRRAGLLRQAGYAFAQRPVAVDEAPRPEETAVALTRRLASAKAAAARMRFPDAVTLAADTVVAQGERCWGKPADREDCARMLRRLSGAAHEVITGVCVAAAGQEKVLHCATEVVFDALEPEWIEAYWATGEPRGKAGGYAIQGRAGSRVRAVRGSYSNVVGLPLAETRALLAEFGIRPAWETAA